MDFSLVILFYISYTVVQDEAAFLWKCLSYISKPLHSLLLLPGRWSSYLLTTINLVLQDLCGQLMANLDSILKNREITLSTKVCIVRVMLFFPVVMYSCESWAIKQNERLPIVVLKKTLESPLDCKEFKPINPKINQPWLLNGRTDAKALILKSDANSRLTEKDPGAGKD